jgi:hypothetical protein
MKVTLDLWSEEMDRYVCSHSFIPDTSNMMINVIVITQLTQRHNVAGAENANLLLITHIHTLLFVPLSYETKV